MILTTDRVPLRAWQAQALTRYADTSPRDFLAVATPGAGKTTFALVLARRLLDSRVVDRVVVVTPTDHLKTQWTHAADAVGINLTPDYGRGTGLPIGVHGPVVTYAGVAAVTGALRSLTTARRTLVILDEVHHAGDSMSWGEAVREAFAPAERRLSLTGTPFRSDINPIPFITYDDGGDGVLRSRADYVYGYGEALSDATVRPVIFLAYSGEMTWRTSVGDIVSADVSDALPREVTAAAWRTALDPQGAWIGQVLRDADRRLTEVRRHIPDAGGLVLASDQTAARGYAKRLRELTGQQAVLVLSDEPGASAKIASFASSRERWMVAVRMVSEGVDVPRLMVGVYATSAATPLYFAQAVGRFVRTRRPGETASIFLPSVPRLLSHAAELERERDHVLRRRDDPGTVDEWTGLEEAEARAAARRESEPGPGVQPLTSEATLDRVVFDGGVFESHVVPADAAEEEFLGIPGLLEPGQVAELLRGRRAAGQAAERPAPSTRTAAAELAALRAELNTCARAYARQRGVTPAIAHSEARRATGGPPAAQADAQTLQARIDVLRRRAVGR
ncbi:MAG: hypothetical protein QG597_2745 [Actinomycetota bacterium]|nr:hypothetical protein [Actinomycetota bacterium]